MVRIDKEVTLDAPLKIVFEYLSDPRNWLEIWPNLIQLYNVQKLPDGGYRAGYEHKIASLRFKGRGEFVEFIPNRWFVVSAKSITHSTITCTFRSMETTGAADKTRITLTVEYEVPIPLLGRLMEYIIVKTSSNEADYILANLQKKFTIR